MSGVMVIVSRIGVAFAAVASKRVSAPAGARQARVRAIDIFFMLYTPKNCIIRTFEIAKVVPKRLIPAN